MLDLLFPKRCISCGSIGKFICKECLGKIEFLEIQQCPSCKKNKNLGLFCSSRCKKEFHFDQLIVATKYKHEGLISKIITTFKYRFSEELGFILAQILKTQFIYHSQFLPFLKNSYLTFVPIHKKRLLYRGFNQSEILANILAKSLKDDPVLNDYFCGVEVIDCLHRKEYRTEQAKLGRAERLVNLQGAFEIIKEKPDKVSGKNFVLIDDVATTLSTLNECSKVLKMAGARYICGLVIARG